ncbi:MAG: methyltransferase domain-containing protein [Planctomycetaceae bacterium]|nr:methyltransferase domain-containing protein [Planctomycetaceae bacterium]MDG2391009.1 methyltransferase domain-containing protein [Planctomycetaceae bacterium]
MSAGDCVPKLKRIVPFYEVSGKLPASMENRDLQPELMDDPALGADDHRAALLGLKRINKISGSSRILWPAIERVAQKLGRPIRVLDLACGGGDVTRGLALKAQSSSLPVTIHGADISETALEYAREESQTAGLDQLEFHQLNILEGDLPTDYDILYSSLFLHHLTEDEAEHFLQKQAQATRHSVLVNDLRRSQWGYIMATIGCHLLSRSPIVHFDGPQSVKAAFRIEEVKRLAEQAGLHSPKFTMHWPQRFLMEWSRSEEDGA